MFIRATIKQPQEVFTPLAWWVGGIERTVATTLILYASGHYLPQFIGGWVALKFAAGWQRYKVTNLEEGGLVGLVGNVLSFGFAIWVTLQMRPDLIGKLANLN